MIALAHTFSVCLTALALSLACARVENAPAAHDANNAALPYNPEAIVLSAEELTQDALNATRRMDSSGRGADGQLQKLPAQEHMRRAAIYHANRAFDEARAHWRAVIAYYPEDSNVPNAHFLVGRSLFQEKRYEEALPIFGWLGDNYAQTQGGSEGFYYVAATLLRLNRAGEAAARYAEYIDRYPKGERVEAAHLNIIDSLREAGRPDDALPWIERTRARYRGQPADTNALFARLRLDVARKDWPSALRTGEELSRAALGRNVGTTQSEVAYLRAYVLEHSGQKEQASRVYQGIADGLGSYYGSRATARLERMGGASKSAAAAREARVHAEAKRLAGDYPAPYREQILRAVKGRDVDPRLMLAIMRQESGFKPGAKSPAGARGLMQFTPDVAAKYAPRVKLGKLSEEDLHRPEVSILLAGAYLDELAKMFPGLPEAVAASYNGGEDNVARWVRRAVHDDRGVFTSEIGFTESKDYAMKVAANLRAYTELYTDDLKPRR
ncbi:MAG TPA: transglycosylase SLT domain-containing protein [Pyrinomonadaceae bacterium]|nr:transglycosylase SLT domain-containing protein [Pyrinomonadaceae bacterium]